MLHEACLIHVAVHAAAVSTWRGGKYEIFTAHFKNLRAWATMTMRQAVNYEHKRAFGFG